MALNNKPGVSRETRQRVLEYAEANGYDFAKLKRKQASVGCVYFVIYKKHGAIVEDTPFFKDLSAGIADGCRECGYTLKTRYLYENDADYEAAFSSIRFSDCIGLLLLGTEMAETNLPPFLSLPFPILLLDTWFEDIPCDSVLINNVQGAYLAATHLLRTTRSQPGYLRSSYSISNFEERSNGFYKAIRSHGLSTGNSIVHRLTPSIEGAYSDMKELLKSREPLAKGYFADNDLIAIGAMRAMREAGIQIPRDIAIVGFDNLPLGKIFDPTLTTIDVPKHEMGRFAARLIAQRLENPDRPIVKLEMNTSLVRRKSG